MPASNADLARYCADELERGRGYLVDAVWLAEKCGRKDLQEKIAASIVSTDDALAALGEEVPA